MSIALPASSSPSGRRDAEVALLRVLAGLTRPTTGTVRTAEGAIGIVFQQATLLPWRTVLANVALPLELAGTPMGDATARALATIARVGLGSFARVYPNELSRGKRMRAALARALVTSPELLPGEPFSSIDELTRERLGEDLMALRASEELTALLVTHSTAEAVFLADRVLMMSPRPGEIAAEVPIPFGRTRTADLRATQEFARLAGHVSNLLRTTTAAA